MNTVSLVLNGRTTADLAQLPEKQRATITTLFSTPPSSPLLGPKRPPHKRQLSRDSPGWYNTEGGMTLDDFAERCKTTLSRCEWWVGRSGQNVVMALMRPTPLLLFFLNPVSIFLWVMVFLVWMWAREHAPAVTPEG